MVNKWPIILCIVWFIGFVGIYFSLMEGCTGYTQTTTLSENTFVNETGKFVSAIKMSQVVTFEPLIKLGIDILYWGLLALLPTWLFLANYICDRYD